MASKHGFEFKSDRLADVAEFRLKNRQVTIIKPTTYMNLSGKAAKYWLTKLNLEPSQSMTIVDELALDFGVIRLKPSGSAGGHNGLTSIQEELATAQYPRLRFGIGSDFHRGGQVDYVLGKWSEQETEKLPIFMDKTIDAIEESILAGLAIAMNKYNTKA